MLHRVPLRPTAVPGLAILLLAATGPVWADDSKLTAEALVARHLETLGPASKSIGGRRILEGACRMQIRRGGAADVAGQTRFMSEGRHLRIDLKFDTSDYWGESFAFDGDRVTIGFIQPLRRSPVGNFLNTYDVILREGMLGGVLSKAWPLLDLEGRHPKLKYDGIKKVDGRPVHQLRYQKAKGQGEMSVTMAFEADTFFHVGTIYSLRLMPGLAQDIQDTAGQLDVLLRLEESFGDFVVVDGFHMPRHWTLTYETGGGASNTLWVWTTLFQPAAP